MFKVKGIWNAEDWLVRCQRVDFEMTFGNSSVIAVITTEGYKICDSL